MKKEDDEEWKRTMAAATKMRDMAHPMDDKPLSHETHRPRSFHSSYLRMAMTQTPKITLGVALFERSR